MHRVDHKENIVEVAGISFSYDGNEVLRDINLSIHRGDYLALVGGNGSGKTTLLKLILGLLQPQEGSIRLFGQDIRSFKAWEKIGYVPQKATSFDPLFPATAEEVVLMGRYGRRGLLNRITDADRTAAYEALEQVGMLPERTTLIGNLSGGQQQRVFIARALAGKPDIIFLDEPTVGVEQAVRQDFYSLLKKMNEDLDLTVVLVTHDLEGVAHEAMHVACVDRTLFFHESVDRYFADKHPVIHPHP